MVNNHWLWIHGPVAAVCVELPALAGARRRVVAEEDSHRVGGQGAQEGVTPETPH